MARRATSLGPKRSLFVFVCLFFILFFFGEIGSGEVARRALSLGPNPALLVPICLFLFVLVLFSFGFVC